MAPPQTSNPAGSPAVRSYTPVPGPQRPADERNAEYDRFEDLARKLVQTPKPERSDCN